MIRINADPQTQREIKASLGWASALGILMIITGLLSLIEPFTAAVVITVFVGFIFVMYGITHAFYAFVTRKLGAIWFIPQFFLGILYLIVGDVILHNPFEGLVTLTLITGILIFIDGIIQIINAFDLKLLHGGGWLFFSGILGIILGIFIWSSWPQSSEWVLGILLGIKLIVNGLTFVMTVTVVRKAIGNDVPPSKGIFNEE